MPNPFRSEADAFRLVVGTLGAFAAIVVAAVVLNQWAGLAVAVVVGLLASAWFFRRRAEPPLQTMSVHRGAEDERRILVIANETVGGAALRNCIRQKSEGYREQVLVVCPALNSPLKHWLSDEDEARAEAEKRLSESLARLADAGIAVDGQVGDSEPLQAIEDAVRTFGPDEIIISTHPEGRSHWLERGVVASARERFTVPITHVVVDLEAEHDEVR